MPCGTVNKIDRGELLINLGSKPKERPHALHIPKVLHSEEVKVSVCKQI
jgi:hypothetical protein